MFCSGGRSIFTRLARSWVGGQAGVRGAPTLPRNPHFGADTLVPRTSRTALQGLGVHDVGLLSAAAGRVRHTTILCVRKADKVVLVGDGQVTQGSISIKPNARKVRRLGNEKTGEVITGFAGATADCMALMDRLEGKLEEYPGQLLRSCVELAKAWRTDRYLRHLNATMVVADKTISLEITGNGDVLEMHDGVIGIGSGGPFASAAARALMDKDFDAVGLDARTIALKAVKIAADMDTGSNHNVIVEEIALTSEAAEKKTSAEEKEKEGKE